MKTSRFIFMLAALAAALLLMFTLRRCPAPDVAPEATPTVPEYLLLIHGGAGNFSRGDLHDTMIAGYYEGLRAALVVGHRILDTGGTALDAVEAVVRYLEDHPLFNAGRGSVFTAEGRNELDASVMDGSTGLAGAVAGVTTVKNPVTAARAVMEHTTHVLLMGGGAEQFARERGLEMVSPDWFFTPHRYRRYLEGREQIDKRGTVGAVALDRAGNLAAATSTGGMNMKRYGRVGDVPIIGAGTWADNATCAVSCTGWGEFFIRNVVAFDVAAQMRYRSTPLHEAAAATIHGRVGEQGGYGGLIAIDRAGNHTFMFNSTSMFRGVLFPDGTMQVMIFSDDEEHN
jgi:L-asparaginase / beta-aspartyl-peptidase